MSGEGRAWREGSPARGCGFNGAPDLCPGKVREHEGAVAEEGASREPPNKYRGRDEGQAGRRVVSRGGPTHATGDGADIGLGVKQDKYLYEAQDYIDAQAGGPGKGWFRIVKPPAEARAVINDGKLAVILGLEFANAFNCKVTFAPDGSETPGCDMAEIDRQIDAIYELGVRGVW